MASLTPASVLSDAAVLVNLLTNSKAVDVVAILAQNTTTDPVTNAINTTFSQVFSAARPMKGTVKETSKVARYPVESGVINSDHHVILPVQIDMVMVIPEAAYTTAYTAIRNAFLNATSLSVQTRTGTYRNMVIENMPHEEEPDMFNVVTMNLQLFEFIQMAPSATGTQPQIANFSPAQPQDQSTITSGLLSGIATTGAVLGLFKASSVWGVH